MVEIYKHDRDDPTRAEEVGLFATARALSRLIIRLAKAVEWLCADGP